VVQQPVTNHTLRQVTATGRVGSITKAIKTIHEFIEQHANNVTDYEKMKAVRNLPTSLPKMF
jgi:hypothetical protein